MSALVVNARELTPEERAQARIDAAQAKRKSIATAHNAARLEQAAIDFEAIADLESDEGYARVIAIDLAGVWHPGVGMPTRIAVRVPRGSDGLAQRFIQTITKHKEGSRERLQAQDALAIECWLYPPKDSDGYKAARQFAPLVLNQAALLIVQAAQGKAEEEGKE